MGDEGFEPGTVHRVQSDALSHNTSFFECMFFLYRYFSEPFSLYWEAGGGDGGQERGQGDKVQNGLR